MVSIDDVVNAVVPLIILVVGVAIFYKPLKPAIDNLIDLFRRITGKSKKDEQFAEGIVYE